MKENIYLAGGWFSPEQMKACTEVEELLTEINEDNFFPRLMNLGTDGIDWNKIYRTNIVHLDMCDTVVVSTVDKDMGTLIEAGYCIAKGKRVVYYTPGIDKPNLMLTHSGQIARTINELKVCLYDPNVTYFKGDPE